MSHIFINPERDMLGERKEKKTTINDRNAPSQQIVERNIISQKAVPPAAMPNASESPHGRCRRFRIDEAKMRRNLLAPF